MGKVPIAMVEDGIAIFCEAMCNGWAAGKDHNNRSEFEKDGWLVKDEWEVGTDGHSWGCTRQFIHGKPFFAMSYQGRYPKVLIPYVKRGIMYNYKRGIFFAGRGPKLLQMEAPDGGEVIYQNRAEKIDDFEEPGSFTNFRAKESVGLFRHAGTNIEPVYTEQGYHRVQGMRLMYI